MFPRQSLLESVKEKLPDSFNLSNLQRNPYAPVKAEEEYQNGGGELLLGRKQTILGKSRQLLAQTSRRTWFAVAALLALVLFVGHLLPKNRTKIQLERQQDDKLYLVIPVSGADTARCRTELTAAVLGYPTPDLAEWDVRFDAPLMHAERQQEKIRIIHEHLDSMGEDRDNDLMILLDGPHSWFQLRAEVLLKRYYAITARENERLLGRMGSEVWSERALTPKVIFSAQNHCSGHTADEMACFAALENPKDREGRRGYPNAALAMGPVRDLCKIFSRMHEKAQQPSDDLRADTLLGEIFGEQQFQREVVRQGDWTSNSQMLEMVVRKLNYMKPSLDDVRASAMHLLESIGNIDYEMGMTLDYGNELGFSVDHTTTSAEWVQHGSSAEEGYRDTPLPEDIRWSMPPFWTTMGRDLPDKSWEDVALLADKRTGSIPAIVNFEWDTSYSSALSDAAHWQKFWMHSHAQKLWEMQNELPRLPMASVVDYNGTEHTFWNQQSRMERDGSIKLPNEEWVEWKEHCEFYVDGEIAAKKGD